MMTPIDTRPSPCVTQVRHGSVCKIVLPYADEMMIAVRRFNATLSYIITR